MSSLKSAAQRAATLLAAVGLLTGTTAFAADLGLSLDGGAETPLTLGGPDGVFGATITNLGDAGATSVKVTAVLPDGTALTDLGANCVPDQDAGGFPCTLDADLASGASTTVGFSVSWPLPDSLPATCPTNRALAVTVSAAETDPVPANNSASLADVTVPLADLTATASGPAEPLADGGTPTGLPLPGDSVKYTGKVTNNGPCDVPGGGLTIDASLDDTGTFGVTFVSGTGGCTPWPVSTPVATSDGVCTVAAPLGKGASMEFTLTEKIALLASKESGGDSIIQSAAYFNYSIAYAGNPAIGKTVSTADGGTTVIPDNISPTTTTLIKGPASACSAIGGEGLAALSLLSGLALWRRRRTSR